MNTSNTEGVWDQTKGKVKQAVGETFNDQSMANEGTADEVKGHAEEAWGNVKDTAHDIGSQHQAEASAETQHDGHSIRESIAHAAESAKDSINRGLDHLKGH